MEIGFGAQRAQLSHEFPASFLVATGDNGALTFSASGTTAAAWPIPVSAPVIRTTWVLMFLIPSDQA